MPVFSEISAQAIVNKLNKCQQMLQLPATPTEPEPQPEPDPQPQPQPEPQPEPDPQPQPEPQPVPERDRGGEKRTRNKTQGVENVEKGPSSHRASSRRERSYREAVIVPILCVSKGWVPPAGSCHFRMPSFDKGGLCGPSGQARTAPAGRGPAAERAGELCSEAQAMPFGGFGPYGGRADVGIHS